MCELSLICSYVAVCKFCAVRRVVIICCYLLFATYSTCFLIFVFKSIFSFFVLFFHILCILFLYILILFCALFLYFCCLFPNFVQF